MNTAAKVLSKLQFKNMIKKIKSHIQRPNINLKIVKGHAFNYIYASDDKLIIVMFSSKMAITLVITSKKAVGAFSDLFDDVYKDSNNILPYLKKISNK